MKYFNHISSTYIKIDSYVSLFAYIRVYVIAVFFSVPITPFLKIIVGLLFGFVGALISATFGDMLVFLCVKYSWGEVSAKGKVKYMSKFKSLVQKNPISILLVSRLLSIPFFVPNILARILKVKNNVFFFTTMIGIITVTFFYVWIGTRVNGALLADDVSQLID